MGGRLYHAALNLLAVGMVARYLKIDGFGQYAYIMAVCTIFMVITDMGINRISIREMSKDLSKANDIFWASSFVKCFFSLITFACLTITINIITHNKEIISASYICALALIFFFIGDIFSAIFIAFEKMEYIILLSFIQSTTYLLFIILFIQLDFGLSGIFWALLISYLARISTGIFITYKNFFKPQPNLDISLSYYLIKEGFPIGVHKVLRKTSFRFDTILIKLMRTLTETGLYHGAYRIIVALMLIPQSITEALFPNLSRAALGSADSLGFLLERCFKLLLILMIPLVTVLIFLSEGIIVLILGENFIQAAPSLMAFSLIWGIMAFSDLFTRFLHASHKQIFVTVAAAIALVVNILLDIFLIHWFGYFGAVIGTLVAEMSFFAVTYYYLWKHSVSISWRRILPKPLFAAGAMISVIYLMNTVGSIVSLSSALGVFFLGLFVLRSFEPHEVEIVKECLHRVKNQLSYFTAQ